MSQDIQTYNPASESVVIYRSADNAVQLDVQISGDTVWLTQQQIATLFQKAKSTISYHITNIFKEGELDEKVVVRKIRITTPHGAMNDKTHDTDFSRPLFDNRRQNNIYNWCLAERCRQAALRFHTNEC